VALIPIVELAPGAGIKSQGATNTTPATFPLELALSAGIKSQDATNTAPATFPPLASQGGTEGFPPSPP
jgi:hypothetical protein